MKAARGRLAALNTHERARRGALVCVLSAAAVAIGLVAAPTASAWGTRCPTGAAAIREDSVVLMHADMTSTSPSRMNGNVQPNDKVQVKFTNISPSGCPAVDVTLVSYIAQGSTWNNGAQASTQIYFDSQSSTPISPGQQGQFPVPVVVPGTCFQVDLVSPAHPIFQLEGQFDPATGATYSAQHRLIDWANGFTGCA
jgi:hypothetical protein